MKIRCSKLPYHKSIKMYKKEKKIRKSINFHLVFLKKNLKTLHNKMLIFDIYCKIFSNTFYLIRCHYFLQSSLFNCNMFYPFYIFHCSLQSYIHVNHFTVSKLHFLRKLVFPKYSLKSKLKVNCLA